MTILVPRSRWTRRIAMTTFRASPGATTNAEVSAARATGSVASTRRGVAPGAAALRSAASRVARAGTTRDATGHRATPVPVGADDRVMSRPRLPAGAAVVAVPMRTGSVVPAAAVRTNLPAPIVAGPVAATA